MFGEELTLEKVKEYYGQVLKTSADLQTSACCTAESVPEYIKPILREVHPEVLEKFYGCGSPLPPALEGCTVVDLGSGSGRDAYVISKLVGSSGRVMGIDMTDEQLVVARKHVAYHTEKFGYKQSNIEFRQGYIEDLESAGVPSNSVDLVVSNCVLNLSPDKRRVFREVFRSLKPGGELYFSDVFADRRIPQHLAEDPVLRGECLGGALYFEDFRRIMLEIGCADFRVVHRAEIAITNPKIHDQIGMVRFQSMTIRAFKMPLEDKCEDYGQVAYYDGTIEQHPHQFILDDHHIFKTGQPMLVCGNTADMVSRSRYGKHFKVVGDKSRHFGLFDCAPTPNALSANTGAAAGACC